MHIERTGQLVGSEELDIDKVNKRASVLKIFTNRLNSKQSCRYVLTPSPCKEIRGYSSFKMQ